MSAACSWGPVGLWRPGARRRLPPAPRGGSPGEEGVVTLCGTGQGPFHPHSALGWRAFSRSKAQGEKPSITLAVGAPFPGSYWDEGSQEFPSEIPRPWFKFTSCLIWPPGPSPPGRASPSSFSWTCHVPKKGLSSGTYPSPQETFRFGSPPAPRHVEVTEGRQLRAPTAPTRQLTWANGSRFVQNVYINSTLLAYRLDKSLPTLTSEKQPEVEDVINHAFFFPPNKWKTHSSRSREPPFRSRPAFTAAEGLMAVLTSSPPRARLQS